MKITYKGEYGLKAMLDLSTRYESGDVVPLTEIAGRQRIPAKYLEQIMLTLKGAGFVESRRGAGGGFLMVKAPDTVTVGDIVRILEGPVEPLSGDRRKDDRSAAATRALDEVWDRIGSAVAEIVDSVTLASLLRRVSDLETESSGFMYQI